MKWSLKPVEEQILMLKPTYFCKDCLPECPIHPLETDSSSSPRGAFVEILNCMVVWEPYLNGKVSLLSLFDTLKKKPAKLCDRYKIHL